MVVKCLGMNEDILWFWAHFDFNHVIAGEQQAVNRPGLFQDRDYPVLNDYRRVLGGLFRALWGLTPDQSSKVFPQTAPADLRLA